MPPSTPLKSPTASDTANPNITTNPMQIRYFTPLTGGGVIHRLPLPGYSGHFSCWFTPEGRLADAEQRRADGKVYPVREGGPAWSALSQRLPSLLLPRG
jgi:hypothetical protein